MEIILGLLIWLIANLIGACIFWGIGNFIILVFGISYNWTLLHGIAAQVIYLILKGIFSK